MADFVIRMFYSGEFHPFRLPVPGLWLDVFQKIRSAGYTGVSFYVDWALHEGQPGKFEADGVFAWEPFFDAARKAGIYLLARPGPYINAEVSGGGYPGWLQRLKGHPRTADEDYIAASDLYAKSIGAIIAKAQITNGGPIILFQPENEYSGAVKGFPFPDPKYFQQVIDQFRRAGIVVPFVSNDASNGGRNAPGQPAAVDIYGHDGYPLGFDCAQPNVWPPNKLPTDWRSKHLQQSPTTPFSIIEFQGGAFDPWGGPGFDKCLSLVNHEFERVFYKNIFSFGVTIFNIYMTYGGTNWGNLGHAGGYTSYDYGAMIAEDRNVFREKYSEAKLEANFIVASPSYLTAEPQIVNDSSIYYVNNKKLTSTLLKGNKTQYLIVRHKDYSSSDSNSFLVTVPNTSAGEVTIPQGGVYLVLNGRDSKTLVFDYEMNKILILYSTAEVFTWKEYNGKTILVVYSGPNEQHEMAVALSNGSELPKALLGSGISAAGVDGYTILSWKTSNEDRALQLGPLTIYFVDRNSAYKHWVIDIPRDPKQLAPYTNEAERSLIIKGGYLIRSATISQNGDTLNIVGDTDSTTPLKIIGGAPPKLKTLTFNGQPLKFAQDSNTIVTTTVPYTAPKISLPDLNALTWYYTDSLPEIQSKYSDAQWSKADYPKTDNTLRNITTPTSLYGSEYGFHAGALVYRGHFQGIGNESTLYLQAAGGSAFGMSAFLDDQHIGSFVGYDSASIGNSTFDLPKVTPGLHVLTVVVDNMGLQENWIVGEDEMKTPRGILDYKLDQRPKEDITWKLTGNYGGEAHIDKARGPLNEGGLWAERQGYHLPSPPIEDWKKSKPTDGIAKAGIAWYVTSFDLNMPNGFDIPLSFRFTNSSTPYEAGPAHAYRVNLYVNGWQFGKYVNNIGPQTKFPVPEGIWNYHGKNWVAMSLWALDPWGARLKDVKLVAGPAVQTGYGRVQMVDSPKFSQRPSVY
ncbi:beta-galactosidase [Tothia fuscella]|uniref:Beta-galactosidase n=1 Tax=Tothia fuscella TaxID=1048955 RepID=A0A9P4NEC7_9PEZI|nr:beta-galactosidase [Tothia fuscella]